MITKPGQRARTWTDERVEQLVGNLLRVGVLTAAAVVLVGGIYYVVRDGGQRLDYHVFHSEPRVLRSISGIAADAFSGSSVGVIQFGLLILLATPVARVVFSVGAFAVLRDRMYVAITLAVLTVLLYSLFGSSG